MSEVVIKVENVSKQYRLGQVGTGTISHDLNRWWAKLQGKEDPTLKIGDVNDRTAKGNSDYVWSLKDINFEINKGDAVGIIGRNGAGKSTLLKILSKVTGPTTGHIKVKGRIASLLEVGTGFHPELTGRENIYLNGAILGMKHHEIKRKFDEIVDFSGVERYIDTPVKRYSSGMYVRLAFAVAAHLESEILIIDEVLAVGDAEFQKKCLGKMGDVSKGEGRTILFVSHNMISIQALCNRGILMNQGTIFSEGSINETVNQYLALNAASVKTSFSFSDEKEAIGNDDVKILSMKATPKEIGLEDEVLIEMEILNTSDECALFVAIDFVNNQEIIAFGTGYDFDIANHKSATVTCVIPPNFLNDGIYTLNLYVATIGKRLLYKKEAVISFEVKDGKRDLGYLGKVNGVVRPILAWHKKK
jgi:lipopolysaccharide transport system ATP-binding protein